MSYVPNAKRYDGALFRRCGRSGIVLPPVSLGLWQNFGGADVFETGRAVVRRAFDRGVTHFDLANNYGPPYGSAEENFGQILRKDFREHRNELLISTKAGWDMWPGPYGLGGSRKYLLASLDESLQPHGSRLCRHFLFPPPDHGRAAGRNHGRAGPGRSSRQGLVCGHLLLQSGAHPRSGQDSAERRRTAADSSAVVLHAESLGGKGLLSTLDELGVGCIGFSPLAQGLLTSKYLKGVPDELARQSGRFFLAEGLSERRKSQARARTQRNCREPRPNPGADGHCLGPARQASYLGTDRSAQRETARRLAGCSKESPLHRRRTARIDRHAQEGEIDLWKEAREGAAYSFGNLFIR